MLLVFPNSFDKDGSNTAVVAMVLMVTLVILILILLTVDSGFRNFALVSLPSQFSASAMFLLPAVGNLTVGVLG
jgi:hypothetical protein